MCVCVCVLACMHACVCVSFEKGYEKALVRSHFKYLLTSLFCFVGYIDTLFMHKAYFIEQRFLSNCLKFRRLSPYNPAALNGQMPFKKSKNVALLSY